MCALTPLQLLDVREWVEQDIYELYQLEEDESCYAEDLKLKKEVANWNGELKTLSTDAKIALYGTLCLYCDESWPLLETLETELGVI